MRQYRWRIGAGFIGVLIVRSRSPAASADDKVILGGGAGIIVGGSYCTLGTIGHDSTGELVAANVSSLQPGDDGTPVTVDGQLAHNV